MFTYYVEGGIVINYMFTGLMVRYGGSVALEFISDKGDRDERAKG